MRFKNDFAANEDGEFSGSGAGDFAGDSADGWRVKVVVVAIWVRIGAQAPQSRVVVSSLPTFMRRLRL